MPNLWTDLGIEPPTPGSIDSQLVVRIDELLAADLDTVLAELKKHGYKVSRSDLVRAASRSLVDSLFEAFEIPKEVTKTQAATAAVSERIASFSRRKSRALA